MLMGEGNSSPPPLLLEQGTPPPLLLEQGTSTPPRKRAVVKKLTPKKKKT
jgi:hypothetical protein